MDRRDAVALIEAAVPRRTGTWADLGAGDGTFTRALTELLGPGSRIYAVDRDPGSIADLEHWAKKKAPNVVPVTGDFTRPLELPGLGASSLDGMLLANALHFVPDHEVVLGRLVPLVRPGGRVVVVEYDRRPASQWVPYPIPVTRLPDLAAAAGLGAFTVTGRRPSAFRGEMYVAVAQRPE